jgi:hypothetical protein
LKLLKTMRIDVKEVKWILQDNQINYILNNY